MSAIIQLQELSPTRSILGVHVSANSYAEIVKKSLRWAEEHQSRARRAS
jgi:hypothetical protein